MTGYPTINYIGNKEKIVDWIISHIPEDADTFFDVFSGGSSVGYAVKRKGLTVYTNDILQINYHIAKSLIENDKVILEKDDVDMIFSGNPESGGFMDTHYSDKFYFKEECCQLDLYRRNMESLADPYKKSLAFILMRRAMIRKMPYSRFNIRWDKIRQLRDEDFSYRHYGRKRAYHNASFRFHFEDNLKEYNDAVFSNGRHNVSYCMDVFDAIDEVEADVIYLDPPYAGTMNDYFGFYGLLDSYIQGSEAQPFANDFIDKKVIMDMFDRLFGKLEKFRYWMMSYNSRSKPSKEEILQLLTKYASDISVYEMPYAYRLTGKEKKRNDVEYLFVVKKN